MSMRTHRRRLAARQLLWTRWLAELRAELDQVGRDADDWDCISGDPCCGTCGASADEAAPECWYCGETL